MPEPGSSGGFNRYRYARNNPLKYTDPGGHIACADVTDCKEPPTPPSPGEDEGWDRVVSYDPDFSYGAYLDGKARYEYYSANPDAYSRDQALSTEGASYSIDSANIYGDYALGECLQCNMDGRQGTALAAGFIPSFGTVGAGNGFGGNDFEDETSSSVYFSSIRPGQQRRQPGGSPIPPKNIPKKYSGPVQKGPPKANRIHKALELEKPTGIKRGEMLKTALTDPNRSKSEKAAIIIMEVLDVLASLAGVRPHHP